MLSVLKLIPSVGIVKFARDVETHGTEVVNDMDNSKVLVCGSCWLDIGSEWHCCPLPVRKWLGKKKQPKNPPFSGGGIAQEKYCFLRSIKAH